MRSQTANPSKTASRKPRKDLKSWQQEVKSYSVALTETKMDKESAQNSARNWFILFVIQLLAWILLWFAYQAK